jgi:hypothetical protein
VAPKPKARGYDQDDENVKTRPKATDVGHYSSVSNINPTTFAEADQSPVAVPPPTQDTSGPEPDSLSSPIDLIRAGDRVSIFTPRGQRLTGRAVMRNRQTGSWTLNMGGAHGTPGVANDENIVAISRAGQRIYGRI